MAIVITFCGDYYILRRNTGKGAQRAKIARDKYSERGKKTDGKNIGLHERLQSFPNEHLCLRRRKLFCKACLELLSLRKHFANGSYMRAASLDS